MIILYMSLMAALSGGSIWPSQHIPKKLTWLPELFFSLGFVYALYPIIGLYALITIIWCYSWFQTGHANALSWGVNADPNRKNTLTPVVEFFYRKGFGRGYSAAFFAVKGFLITLPIGGLGVVLWPLAYDIGAWLELRFGFKNGFAHAVSELLSGAFIGLYIYVFTLCV